MITVHFYLRFSSAYGQQFFITGNTPELGNMDSSRAMPLQYLNEDWWYGTFRISGKGDPVQYKYILRNNDGFENMEWPADRQIDLSAFQSPEIQVMDVWNYAGLTGNVFYTQPFQETLLAQEAPQVTTMPEKGAQHFFKVKAPVLAPGQTLCLLGSDKKLGNWETDKCIPMKKEGQWFSAALNLSDGIFPIAYKYGVYDTAAKSFVRYEDGPNRLLHGTVKKLPLIIHDGYAVLPYESFRGAGVAIPVFSLRSQNSLGTGEFRDIRLLADWCKSIGMKLIQLLPVNDTSATHTSSDSYPYAAISAFALHPLFINLEQVAGKHHTALLKDLNQRKAELNSLETVDYESVMKLKREKLKQLFGVMKKEWLENKAYKKFLRENEHWLLPYAAFCYLRDKYQTAEFQQWKTLNRFDRKAIEPFFAPDFKDFDAVAIHLFTQWHLHLQLKDASDYVHEQGMILKGDIPIGIYRYSCDAWEEPELYNMDFQAGAPPDDFAVKGQNWGFPTYNWQRMQQDGFNWWKRRFAQMSHYFDAFRIDHILGFFRIWSIPMDAVEGIMGKFVPALPVMREELEHRGIWFDYPRFCRPFITKEIIASFFGEKAEAATEQFLQKNNRGTFDLKAEFNTQRKIAAWMDAHPEYPDWMRQKLFDLISNVIFFEEPGSGEKAFHFRFAMEQTTSFALLDDHVQQQLRELYVDYYFKRQNGFWRLQAMQKLPALKEATRMLICGEDLGMVPDCVPGVMKDLGFLSLEIQRMPKDPAHRFFHPADAPYLSVVTPSTHDMSTIRGWWEENQDNTRHFYQEQLGQWGDPPYYCEDWINKAIVVQHLYSPAMWSVFQLQDLMGMDNSMRRQNPADERINIPADPKHYWRYRMHLTLEQLQTARSFNGELKMLLSQSGRS